MEIQVRLPSLAAVRRFPRPPVACSFEAVSHCVAPGQPDTHNVELADFLPLSPTCRDYRRVLSRLFLNFFILINVMVIQEVTTRQLGKGQRGILLLCNSANVAVNLKIFQNKTTEQGGVWKKWKGRNCCENVVETRQNYNKN